MTKAQMNMMPMRVLPNSSCPTPGRTHDKIVAVARRVLPVVIAESEVMDAAVCSMAAIVAFHFGSQLAKNRDYTH
jgi:hypothetical protein